MALSEESTERAQMDTGRDSRDVDWPERDRDSAERLHVVLGVLGVTGAALEGVMRRKDDKNINQPLHVPSEGRECVQRQHGDRQQEEADKPKHPGLGQPLLRDRAPLCPQGLLAGLGTGSRPCSSLGPAGF